MVLVLWSFAVAVFAEPITVIDDWQRAVTLDSAARRIVALAPHLTELVYAADGGDYLVGVSAHCDYPPAAKALPVVADYRTFNRELLVQLNPDLLLVWGVMLKQPLFQRLRAAAYHFYVSEPNDFDDIANTLEAIGVLIAKTHPANARAAQFRQTLEALRRPPQARRKTAYLLWLKPTLSVNQESFISKAISLCGGVNIYAELQPQVVRLNREALLYSSPDYVIHSFESGLDEAALVALFGAAIPSYYVASDWIQRPSLRIVHGVEAICRMYGF